MWKTTLNDINPPDFLQFKEDEDFLYLVEKGTDNVLVIFTKHASKEAIKAAISELLKVRKMDE